MLTDETETPRAEFRAVARVDKPTKERLEKLSERTGLTESDIIRIGLDHFLPQFEKGKINPFAKKAA
jgi:predicted DNA-binding protein